jgi:hypothetical protein
MRTIENWRKRSIKTIGEVLADVEPREGETGDALYARAIAAVKAKSWSAWLALMLFWRDDYRCLASNYCTAKDVPQSSPGWRIRKATPEDRAIAASFGVPWLSWHRFEQYLRKAA